MTSNSLSEFFSVSSFAELASTLSYLAVLIGAVPSFVSYLKRSRLEIKSYENRVYDELDQIYRELNVLLLSYPQLGASVYYEPSHNLAGAEKEQQGILFDVTVSMFEKAFLAYADVSEATRKAQWYGWEGYIRDFCRKPSFRIWWFETADLLSGDGLQYDKRFEDFIGSILLEEMVEKLEQMD